MFMVCVVCGLFVGEVCSDFFDVEANKVSYFVIGNLIFFLEITNEA